MAKTNEELVTFLSDSGFLKTPRVVAAFHGIKREDFVLPKDKDDAYGDYPLSIGYGGTISQPSTVAFMLELLAPGESEKILDVGSGSGWTTALLAHLVGEDGGVWGVEIVSELVVFGKSNLSKYPLPHARIVEAKDTLGLRDEAPFDKILVSAAGQEIPQELIEQLKVGGRLVVPAGNSVWKVDKVSEVDVEKEEFPGFVFVPLR